MIEKLKKTVDIAVVDKDFKLLRWLRRKKIIYDKNGEGKIIKDGKTVYFNVGLNRWEYQAK